MKKRAFSDYYEVHIFSLLETDVEKEEGEFLQPSYFKHQHQFEWITESIYHIANSKYISSLYIRLHATDKHGA